MKDMLGIILDNSKDWNEFVESANKQGYKVKPSFIGVYNQYKQEQAKVLGIAYTPCVLSTPTIEKPITV